MRSRAGVTKAQPDRTEGHPGEGASGRTSVFLGGRRTGPKNAKRVLRFRKRGIGQTNQP